MNSFVWQLLGPDGVSLVRTSSPFPTQGEAEAWLSEDWSGLRDEGISAVTLVDGAEVVYGPMSLDEAG